METKKITKKRKETSKVLKKHLKEIGFIIPKEIELTSISYRYKGKKK